MNNNEGTRNFETVQKTPQQPKGNKNKPDAKKIITVAIFAIAIAVILLFSGVIVSEIVYSLIDDEPEETAKSKVSFETVSVSNIKDNYYLNTVNKAHTISSSAKANAVSNLVNVYDYNSALKEDDPSFSTKYQFPDSKEIKLLPEVTDAFNKMMSDLYKATGCDHILLAYGYLVPKAGTLECDYILELGSSVYIKLFDGESSMQLTSNAEVNNWINKNCAKYGFINSDLDPNESDEQIPSTQFRYVGVSHATYIEKNNMSFDSYLTELKKHSTDKMLEFKGLDGKSYGVYYVSGSDNIKVPSNYNYDVSSDNMGGYVVTVHLSEEKE